MSATQTLELRQGKQAATARSGGSGIFRLWQQPLMCSCKRFELRKAVRMSGTSRVFIFVTCSLAASPTLQSAFQILPLTCRMSRISSTVGPACLHAPDGQKMQIGLVFLLNVHVTRDGLVRHASWMVPHAAATDAGHVARIGRRLR